MTAICDDGSMPFTIVSEPARVRLGYIRHDSDEIPEGYTCSTCGAHGCKLWRDQTIHLEPGEGVQLYCRTCAGDRAGCVDEHGRFVRIESEATLHFSHGGKMLIPATYFYAEKPDGTIEWHRHNRTPLLYQDWWSRIPMHPQVRETSL